MTALLVSTLGARAQNLSVSASTVNHPGGYQVTCHGGNDGSISLNISGGVPPYSILWSNNSSANPLTGLAAGVYTATVSDSLNNTAQVQVTLLQPPALSATSSISNYNGFAISTFTKADGQVQVHPQGGTPPYTVVWNDNFNGAVRDSLSAGTYSFTLSDVNGCSTTGSRTLNQPTALQVSVSQVQGTQCHDTQDGSALLNISGGVPPYSIGWDNGSFSEQPTNLNGGENHYIVRDANQARVESMVVIPQPTKMQLTLHASQYANGMNVSCYDCYNGSLSAQVSGGTAPYTYYWNEDTVAGTNSLSNLNGGTYTLEVKDANGCRMQTNTTLRMPERSDWTMYGNIGSDPATQFIGTSDSTDVVFKANGQEAMRIKSDGEVEIANSLKLVNPATSSTLENNSLLMIDSDGNVIRGPASSIHNNGNDMIDPDISYSCNLNNIFYPWQNPIVSTNGNNNPLSDQIIPCPDMKVGIGVQRVLNNYQFQLNGAFQLKSDDIVIDSKSAIGGNIRIGNGNNLATSKFLVYSNSQDVLFNIKGDGKVGIGIANPDEKLHVVGNSYFEGDKYIIGKVGIGTTSPAEKLHIVDPSMADLLLQNTGGVECKFKLQATNGAGRILSNGGVRIWMNSDNNFQGNYDFVIAKNGESDGAAGTVQLFKVNSDGVGYIKDLWVKNPSASGVFPDYVFDKNYKLKTLSEVKSYIEKHKHLPNFPAAKEIEANEGISVSELVVLLTRQVEEHTLYLIKQQERIEAIEAENRKLQLQIINH
jgi:hypothetical protein